MMWRRGFAVLCSVCLLGEGLAAPALVARGRRADAVADADNEVTSKELTVADDSSNTTTSTSPPITSAFNTDEIGSSLPSGNSSSSEASPASSSDSEAESSPSSSSDSEAESSNPSPDAESRSSVDFTPESSPESSAPSSPSSPTSSSDDDDDDDEDFADLPPSNSGGGGGGSNLFSLINLAGSLFPASSGNNEDGQSDLGSLLATVGGIVANLSGDGFDLNAVVATALGLFVGLLSEGNENPGTVIANYLLTSLDTITEGGAQNNGAFFGNFISKLVKGTSAVPAESSEDENMMKMPMADSAGFLASFLSALLGEMSKGSSGGWES